MINRLLILFLFSTLNNYSQIKNSINFNKDTFINKEIKAKKIHLIGEFHNISGNLRIGAGYLNHLNSSNIFPKYWIIERGYAYSYLFNYFLETGDEYCLSLLEYYEDTKKFYQGIREYWNQLEKDKKFRFIGVDSENDIYRTYYVLRLVIMKEINLGNILNKKETKITKIIDSFLSIKTPELYDKKILKNDLYSLSEALNTSDSNEINNIETRFELKKMINSYKFDKEQNRFFYKFESIDYKKRRELFLVNSFQTNTVLDTNTHVFGQLGIYHVLLNFEIEKGETNFATKINSGLFGNFLKNQVSDNIIWYKSVPLKHYKKLNLNLKHYKNEFNKLKENNIVIKGIENHNFILYKNNPN